MFSDDDVALCVRAIRPHLPGLLPDNFRDVLTDIDIAEKSRDLGSIVEILSNHAPTRAWTRTFLANETTRFAGLPGNPSPIRVQWYVCPTCGQRGRNLLPANRCAELHKWSRPASAC